MHKYENTERYSDAITRSGCLRFSRSLNSIVTEMQKQINDIPVDINQFHNGVQIEQLAMSGAVGVTEV